MARCATTRSKPRAANTYTLPCQVKGLSPQEKPRTASKIKEKLTTAGYRRVPQGTAGYRRVPQGTAGYRRVPQGTAGYRRVPQGTTGNRIQENLIGEKRVTLKGHKSYQQCFASSSSLVTSSLSNRAVTRINTLPCQGIVLRMIM